LLEAEKMEAVRFAVASLPSPHQFKVVFLHYLGGLTHQNIATLLALRHETVNSRLQDGRRSLRQCYKRMENLLEA
jgi:DNA-directed RNA polymerase specialized sigma24 family protein